MADTTPTNSAGTPAAAKSNEALAQNAQQGQLPNLPVGDSAGIIATANGGNPNGKGRKDGLTPGSEAAKKVDREKARIDKQKQRARLAAQKVPNALPSASPPGPRIQHVPLVDHSQETAESIPIQGAGEIIQEPPWSGADCEPAVLDTIGLLEEADCLAIEGKLKKCHLSKANFDEMLADAPWPTGPKKSLAKYGGNCFARLLNAVGIPSRYKDVVNVLPAAAAIINDRVKLHRRLDELIKAANATAPAAVPAKTP